MRFFFASFLSFASCALAVEITQTTIRCQTRLGPSSAYEVPSHTETRTIISAPVTVEFNKPETVTETPESLWTFEKTQTSISTVNSTITEKFAGGVWTTTLTRYVGNGMTVNNTVLITTGSTTWTTTTMSLVVPTPDGFQYIDQPMTSSTSSDALATETATESTSASSDTASLAAPNFIGNGAAVYIIKDGKLIAADLNDLKAAQSSFEDATNSLQDSTASASSTSSVSDASTSPTGSAKETSSEEEAIHTKHVHGKSHAVTSQRRKSAALTTGRIVPKEGPDLSEGPAQPTKVDSSKQTEEMDNSGDTTEADSSKQTTEADIPDISEIDTHAPEYTAAFHKVPRLPKRGLQERGLVKREYQKEMMGLRGVMMSNTMSASVAFPTLVQCTKKISRESTIYKNLADWPATVTAANMTTTITTISTITSYITVPNKKPTSIASYVTTSTLSTILTKDVEAVETRDLIYTLTSTYTAHAACATQNFIGPVGANEEHIINVYNRGMEKYSTFDLGYSQTAEECCIECMRGSGCAASVFENNNKQCMLLLDSTNMCRDQKSAAGFFVSKKSTDRPRRHERWPDFVLSNGPCGYLYDGGIES